MNAALYRTIWRWHFYAGLLVLPLVLVLSLSGALFLFKPQVERWEERAFQGLPTSGAVTPAQQVTAALVGFPGAHFASYRLPEREGDAAAVHLTLAGGGMTDAFVSPQGRLLGSIDPDSRIIAFDRRLHGQLLIGRQGSWLVELAASWAIVLIATGLYLWWPRGQGLAGVLWPRLGLSGRPFWRDLHAVTGFWVSGIALVLLFTGLPWADVWGSAFKAVRQEFGLVKGAQDWTIGGKPADSADPHAEHNHSTMAHHHSATQLDPVMLNVMVAEARIARLAFPALVVPPGAPAGEGGHGQPAKGWVVKSDTQNRPQRVTLRYDMRGVLQSREDFATRHPIDKLIAYGVAWHEGQWLGWVNQAVGLMTALMLIALVISGTVLWWRRRQPGTLGAPPISAQPGRLRHWGGRALLAFLILWLPLFTASLLIVLLLDRLVLPRLPRAARWLGAGPRPA
jgi:uncharacterized iron-regulated membrane protein